MEITRVEPLAHLVFYDESYVAQVEAILAQRPFVPPRGRFDDLNAQVVAASRGVTVADLLRRLQAAAGHLAHIANGHAADQIVIRFKQGVTPRTLARLLGDEAGHTRHHLQNLERQAKRDPSREVEQLRRAVDAFCRLIRELPEASLAEQEWGPKEVLAHLVWWHEYYVARIEAAAAGQLVAEPPGRPVALNAQAAAGSHGVSVAELLRRWQEADERLRDFGQTMDPQMIVVTIHRPTGFIHGCLDDLIPRVESHIREHHRELRRVAPL
jgi:hypothetical protein